ncbi:hypothetical protein CRG98_036972 [Punica granatum]|uniref:Uncharacterized protein n=1 Tax=Punica granatum TaxID=22663 RepID=A0A2I0IG67_PUNGR|nr:hypothetical protein CRG98_036972 [Punica granatum]
MVGDDKPLQGLPFFIFFKIAAQYIDQMYTVLAEGLQTLAMPPRNDSPSEVTHASNVVVDPKCER